MQILHSIRRLPRRPIVAASPAPLHYLSTSLRPLLSFMASPAPRWWLPTLARRNFPLMAAPNPPVRHASRFSQGPQSMATISRVKGDESAKSYRRLPISSGNVIIISQDDEHAAITEDMNNTDTESSAKTKNIVKRSTISDIIDKDEMRSDGDVCRTTSEVTDGKQDACGQNLNLSGSEEDQKSVTKDHTAEIMVSEGEEVSDNEGHAVSDILAESRHRDGSMYRGMDLWWKKEFCVADCNESQLEAMRLSYPSDCIIDNGTCLKHFPSGMLQIFSLKVAKIPADYGVVELYGYVAVRDDLDQLRNYVVNICRDDPITVEQLASSIAAGRAMPRR